MIDEQQMSTEQARRTTQTKREEEMTEQQTLCSRCFDELHCERIINIECQVKCQRCGRECLGYVTEIASTTRAEGGYFTPTKTGTTKCTGIPGPINAQGEREPHNVLLIFPDGKVQTEDGQIFEPVERSDDGTEVRYQKVAEPAEG